MDVYVVGNSNLVVVSLFYFDGVLLLVSVNALN
jgi:hypothetical protein